MRERRKGQLGGEEVDEEVAEEVDQLCECWEFRGNRGFGTRDCDHYGLTLPQIGVLPI